jgi:hypothetical protein|tara:strand:- start:2232 stop:2555 length:324 start_codon:yes stop_codon:yes gene_type:complete
MPNVNGKQFGYGPKGKKAAKKYAKKHGLKVKHKDNPGYYAESEDQNSYKRIYNILTETRASKKTQAAKKKFEAGQRIFGKIKDFNPGAKKFRPKAKSEIDAEKKRGK